jgi:hypothetical protein
MKPAANNPKLTPKLRFPEFRGGPAWEEKELRNLAAPVAERAVSATRAQTQRNAGKSKTGAKIN